MTVPQEAVVTAFSSHHLADAYLHLAEGVR
jgi:hypothetical protein